MDIEIFVEKLNRKIKVTRPIKLVDTKDQRDSEETVIV
jgi:hypothetical protein